MAEKSTRASKWAKRKKNFLIANNIEGVELAVNKYLDFAFPVCDTELCEQIRELIKDKHMYHCSGLFHIKEVFYQYMSL